MFKVPKIIAAAVLAFTLAACNSGDQSSSGAAPSTSKVPVGDGIATLAWDAPTVTTSGTALTDLAGYRIYYGTDGSNLSQVVSLNGVGIETYVIENLEAGTWYFAIKAVTSAGVESPLSNVVSKTID